jgi:hypothetical protein
MAGSAEIFCSLRSVPGRRRYQPSLNGLPPEPCARSVPGKQDATRRARDAMPAPTGCTRSSTTASASWRCATPRACGSTPATATISPNTSPWSCGGQGCHLKHQKRPRQQRTRLSYHLSSGNGNAKPAQVQFCLALVNGRRRSEGDCGRQGQV